MKDMIRHIRLVAVIIVSSAFLIGCNTCEKLQLTTVEKDWVTHFHKGDTFYYKNFKGQSDILIVQDSSNYYTPCNAFELGWFQNEVYVVIFRFLSANAYHGQESIISISTEDNTHRIPEIFVANLGPHRNSLENVLPKPIDTTLNGQEFKSLYFYDEGVHTEQYGEVKYLKCYFWSKILGLVAYTTNEDETFIKVH